MRKDAKNKINTLTVNARAVQNYHANSGSYGESYAFAGFGENLYFTSDRTEKLTVTDDGLQRPSNKAMKGFGLEIEIESNINSQLVLAEILEKVVFSHFPAHLFKMQNDGSLDGNSNVEVITQVMTKEFIRNHYADFKAMWNYLKELRSLPGNSCGMHCNLSTALFGKDTATQEKNIMKLHNFINKNNQNYSLACRLLNRDENYNSYCRRMQPDYLDRCGSHGYSMNYKHLSVGRVEIRLVGPQKSFGNFRNTMEVIFHLISKTKELSAKDFENPAKLWSGCNKYVYDRLTSINAPFTSETWDAIRENMSDDEYI